MRKYISWRTHTGLLGLPVNQKEVFYDSHVKERAAAELLIQSIYSHGQNSWQKYRTDFFLIW
jgi:hypothetical protein